MMTFLLGAVVALSSASTVQAATLSRIFLLRFETASADFMGLGALPQSLSLLATLDDSAGNFTRLELYNGDLGTGAKPLINTFNGAASFWSIGNGPTDTFSLTGFSATNPGRILSFTINTFPGAVSDTNGTVANADAILRQPAVLGGAFTFGNATGYAGTIQAVPEPGTMALLVGAVACVGLYRRRKAKVA